SENTRRVLRIAVVEWNVAPGFDGLCSLRHQFDRRSQQQGVKRTARSLPDSSDKLHPADGIIPPRTEMETRRRTAAKIGSGRWHGEDRCGPCPPSARSHNARHRRAASTGACRQDPAGWNFPARIRSAELESEQFSPTEPPQLRSRSTV